MVKGVLHLSIEPELINLAKSMNINLSSEFENWIRIRVNQKEEVEKDKDYLIDIAKHKEAIQMLENKINEKKRIEEQIKEEEDMLNQIVDREIEQKTEGLGWKQIIALRTDGIISIWKNKFNMKINRVQVFDMLTAKLKEKGVDVNE